MEIAISTSQLIVGKTVSRQSDGSLKALRQLFGIVPVSLGDALAAKAARIERKTASASSSLDAFLDAQEATQRDFQLIGVPAGTTLTAREPVHVGNDVYLAVHAGSLYADVDGRVLTHYADRASQNAAKDAARKGGI